MKTNVDKDKYQIYYDIEAKLYCVVKKVNVSKIQKTIKKFKDVEKVPDNDKCLTKGVYLKNIGEDEHNLMSENENEREIKIKNLRFDK